MGRFHRSSYTQNELFDGDHRFEHWYRDNTVYFITSKVRDGYHAFLDDGAKEIFWDLSITDTSVSGLNWAR